MLLKAIIVILFIAVLISLSSGLVFLMKDVNGDRKRTLYALGIRATLAALLVGTITYGFMSGQLRSTAPWDQRAHSEAQQPETQQP